MVLSELEREIKACRVCVDSPRGKPLPHEPRPIVVLSRQAKVQIIGQAPGTRVHASGRPFTDPSGDRLREWLGISSGIFYDQTRIAITPMGFCFPGLDAKGGDLPPRKECAVLWQQKISKAMPQVELVLLIGLYAQKHHLGILAEKNLTANVAGWKRIYEKSCGPKLLPLPHPSWRNNAWIAKNSWFSNELLPFLRERVQALV